MCCLWSRLEMSGYEPISSIECGPSHSVWHQIRIGQMYHKVMFPCSLHISLNDGWNSLHTTNQLGCTDEVLTEGNRFHGSPLNSCGDILLKIKKQQNLYVLWCFLVWDMCIIISADGFPAPSQQICLHTNLSATFLHRGRDRKCISQS